METMGRPVGTVRGPMWVDDRCGGAGLLTGTQLGGGWWLPPRTCPSAPRIDTARSSATSWCSAFNIRRRGSLARISATSRKIMMPVTSLTGSYTFGLALPDSRHAAATSLRACSSTHGTCAALVCTVRTMRNATKAQVLVREVRGDEGGTSLRDMTVLSKCLSGIAQTQRGTGREAQNFLVPRKRILFWAGETSDRNGGRFPGTGWGRTGRSNIQSRFPEKKLKFFAGEDAA